MPRFRGTNRVDESPTFRRLTRLAKQKGQMIEFTPSEGGVTSEGNRAEWAIANSTFVSLHGDAAAVRRELQEMKDVKGKGLTLSRN